MNDTPQLDEIPIPRLDAAMRPNGLRAIADGFLYRAGQTDNTTLCVWDTVDILRRAANRMEETERGWSECREFAQRVVDERDEARKQLRVAVGLLSTTQQFQDQHPEEVLKFVEESAK